jgi:hypothetical protein
MPVADNRAAIVIAALVAGAGEAECFVARLDRVMMSECIEMKSLPLTNTTAVTFDRVVLVGAPAVGSATPHREPPPPMHLVYFEFFPLANTVAVTANLICLVGAVLPGHRSSERKGIVASPWGGDNLPLALIRHVMTVTSHGAMHFFTPSLGVPPSLHLNHPICTRDATRPRIFFHIFSQFRWLLQDFRLIRCWQRRVLL